MNFDAKSTKHEKKTEMAEMLYPVREKNEGMCVPGGGEREREREKGE